VGDVDFDRHGPSSVGTALGNPARVIGQPSAIDNES
jgi:hypothetical protein